MNRDNRGAWASRLARLSAVPLLMGLMLVQPRGAVAWQQQPRRPAPAPLERTAQRASDKAADEQAIRATAEAYIKAFNAQDAQALAALWTIDGDYMDETGEIYKGREAIARRFADLFQEASPAKLEIDVESVSFLSPDVALENGTARVTPSQGEPTSARYTAVHVKRDGRWMLASVRDSAPIQESGPAKLKQLAWLIGQWTASGDDQSMQTKCEWIAGERFISRAYSISRGGKVVRSGLQIIGWDPLGGQIVSWQFDSEGGFGSGSWTRDGRRWLITSIGTLPDGTETLATNILAPLDADSFTWQSTGRVVGGATLPDTEPVKLTRAPNK